METVREALTQSRAASRELALHLSGKDKGGETILETDIGSFIGRTEIIRPYHGIVAVEYPLIATDKYLTNMFAG